MISGLNIVRNCIENGYPFVESILSALPICDEYLINDGGSTDGTTQALERLAYQHPKIRLFNTPDTQNTRWDCVSDQINQMIARAKYKWIFLGNADELIHERDTSQLKQVIESCQYRILRFDRREVVDNWSRLSTDVYHPARVTKKEHEVRQDWNAYGGDEFLYDDGWYDPDRKIRSGFIIYHLFNVFPENKLNKLRNDAEHLSPGDAARVNMYLHATITPYVRPTSVYSGLPALAKGLATMPKYHIREELFDKRWLRRITGLDY